MRICARTGLALIDEKVVGHRIAKSSYGPLNPVERPQASDRSGWSRFDTPGRTVYLADTARTAFLETLAPSRVGPRFAAAVQFAADFFGIPLEQAEADIREEWTRNGNMVPGWLPASWRDGRLLYEVKVDDAPSWVDMTAAETIAVLDQAMEPFMKRPPGDPTVTLGVIAGENRSETTFIAHWIRSQILDDGSYPAGVRFHSKFGGGLCWAYWMRRTDDGLGSDPISVVATRSIDADDADLTHVLDLYGASCR